MNLKNLSDDVLLAETERAATREREALSVVLHHIREVDRRRLYSALKYQSLSDYMIKHLKYTEDQAWPRISAMKLLKEIPEIESKINDGLLSLSNLNIARRVFAQEEKRARTHREGGHESDQADHFEFPHEPVAIPRTTASKLAVLEKLEHVSKREAEKILRAETGVRLNPSESVRELSDGTIELKTAVSKEAVAMIKELKADLAHSHPGMSTGQLLELALAALRDSRSRTLKAKRAAAHPVPEQAEVGAANANRDDSASRSRYITASVRHHVWLRDGGACKNCGSSHAIQYEHIIPFSLGGESTTENVRLLCRSCNQRTAIEALGATKMSSYLKAPRSKYVYRSGTQTSR